MARFLNCDSLINQKIEDKLEIIELNSCLFKDGNMGLAETRNLTRFWACAHRLVSWDTFPPVTRVAGNAITLNMLKSFITLDVLSNGSNVPSDA